MTRRLLVFLALALAVAASARADPADDLRARYEALRGPLQNSPFNQPLVLESSEAKSKIKGEVFALLGHPFGLVSDNLQSPEHWCDILVLHLNTKYCHAMVGGPKPVLRVRIGKKTPEDLGGVPRVDFSFRPVAATPRYLAVLLDAPDGPMDTADCRILLEAVALDGDKTFLHLTYSYSAGFISRMAMRAYLATLGRGKVGFTVKGLGPDGQPDYMDGLRAVVERNTVRYYLAIESFLAAARLPAAQQVEARLQGWFAATERYARQLHEIDKDDYLSMKRAEIARQQLVQ